MVDYLVLVEVMVNLRFIAGVGQEQVPLLALGVGEFILFQDGVQQVGRAVVDQPIQHLEVVVV